MIALLVIVVIAAIVLEIKSLERPVNRITYRLEPSVQSVEQGEEFSLRTTIENRTGYQLPYLFVEEGIPEEVCLLDKDRMDLVSQKSYQVHRSILFVKRHQRVKRNIRAKVYKRGMVRFQYATLRIGDFLGIKELKKKVEYSRSVVVYPFRLYDEKLAQILSDVFGEVSVNSFLYEDPVLIRGYRDYTGREPLRAISPLMTARRNELTVKEFDHTREPMVDLIFDVGYKGNFDHYFTQKEALFSVVRTICEGFEQKGTGYRLITNAYYAAMEVHGVNVMQSGGSGGSNMTKILEVLGMASNASMCDTKELLARAFSSFSQEKSFVYICQRREEETEALLKAMEARYGVTLHRVYGEDFEESFLKEAARREEQAV